MVYDIDFATRQGPMGAQVGTAPPALPKHLKNSYASETPVTDGERVYFYFGNAGLFAFDLDGKPVWSKAMGPFKTRNNWGAAASPALHGDRVYIVNDNDEQSFLAAFDKRTGAEVWRVNRMEGTNWSSRRSYGRTSRRTEIVTAGSDRVRSYDSGRKAVVGAHGDVHDHDSHAASRSTGSSTSAPATLPIRCGRRTRSVPVRPVTSL